jgi:glycine C-acetyltransferase
LNQPFLDRLARQCDELRTAGLYKPERVLASPQQPIVRLADGRELINLCANNYLGLANHPSIREAAHRAIDRYGYGMASVRFICGTQGVHKELETRLSAFLGMDDTILYSSCFDANGGLFETLLDEQDAVISDDMSELEARLEEARDARVKLIATDGVFSMDGVVARLREICDIAERHGALVMVDDSHATGFVGHGGRGTPEFREVMGRIDILTGTLGKALGGAAGGYTAARREIVAWLRQRSRPYLFSNSIPPVIAATTLRVLDLVESSDDLRAQLRRNTAHFRRRMTEAGFDIVPGEHPIAPVMLGDAGLAARFAERLLERGVYVIGFSYPVVPMGKARIRTQMCAGHSIGQLDTAIDAFIAVGHELEVLKPGNRGETGA